MMTGTRIIFETFELASSLCYPLGTLVFKPLGTLLLWGFMEKRICGHLCDRSWRTEMAFAFAPSGPSGNLCEAMDAKGPPFGSAC